jgi:phosphoribosylformylglycinamidine cyclo-ligase
MVVIASPAEVSAISDALEGAGESVFEIGRIEQAQRGCTVTGGDWTATHNA